MVPFEYEYEYDKTAEPDGYSPAELVVYGRELPTRFPISMTGRQMPYRSNK
jgi:hypothetical protein